MKRSFKRTKTKSRTLKKPLFLKNPYRTTGVTQRASKVTVGPMRRDGITSIENEERARRSMHLSQLSNAGMVKQMKELGVIPDDLGVNMSDFTGNVAALPSGITNLEDIQNEADVARQIQQYNAGILSDEQRQQKALMEIAKKRKNSEYKQKIIQWLAETDELDQVPIEFAEEVEDYYQKHAGKKEQVAKARKERREKEEKAELAKLKRRMYWQSSSNPFNTLQPKTSTGVRYSTNTGLFLPENGIAVNPETIERKKRMKETAIGKIEKKREDFEREKRAYERFTPDQYIVRNSNDKYTIEGIGPFDNTEINDIDYAKGILEYWVTENFIHTIEEKYSDLPEARSYIYKLYGKLRSISKNQEKVDQEFDYEWGNLFDPTAGKGIIDSGWRAPRLHKLVRPLKRFEIEEGPDKIIEDQKQALDDRRTMYKDEQTHQRGTTPPKDMVERAMPKLAEPFLASTPSSQLFGIPNFGIVPHPFVFPNKKYWVKTGI